MIAMNEKITTVFLQVQVKSSHTIYFVHCPGHVTSHIPDSHARLAESVSVMLAGSKSEHSGKATHSAVLRFERSQTFPLQGTFPSHNESETDGTIVESEQVTVQPDSVHSCALKSAGKLEFPHCEI